MIRSWAQQVMDFYLPPLQTGACDLMLSPSPREVASAMGLPYGQALRVRCRCLPADQYLGDREDVDSARKLWSIHQNRSNNDRPQTRESAVA